MRFRFHIHYRKGLLQNNLSLLLSEDTSRIRASLASVEPQMLFKNPSYLVLILLCLFSFILYLNHHFL